VPPIWSITDLPADSRAEKIVSVIEVQMNAIAKSQVSFASAVAADRPDITPPPMANVTVVGAQWGDEGKGKIVDWLSERADVIARFQGGHNAGHTLVIDGVVYKLSLLPSASCAAASCRSSATAWCSTPGRCWPRSTSSRAGRHRHPRQPDHRRERAADPALHGELDRAREAQASVAKIGTTGRGIGPAYEDKVGRRAIRVADLAMRRRWSPHRPAAHPPRRAARGPRPAAGGPRRLRARCWRSRRSCCPSPARLEGAG
jgi:hypothetical protein